MTSYAKSHTRFLASAVLSLAALACFDAQANSQDYTPFNTRYPTYFTANSCNSCHIGATSPPVMNSYGSAYKTAVNALGGRTGSNPNTALGNIEPNDADGDGYTNKSELINAGYLAHDSNSHPTASVTAASTIPAKSGTPGTTVSYTVSITNNGNITDTFTLSVSTTSGQSWTPSIVGVAGQLGAGVTTNVTVNVAVSSGATNGQTSTSTLTATSQARSAATSSIGLTTTATVAAPSPRFVSAATGVNTGTCTGSGTPCRTITYAMSQAAAGDTINVAPGTYSVSLGEVFPITVKSGIQLLGSAGHEVTLVDGTGDTVQNGLLRSTSNTAPATIRGFTFRNGLNLAPQAGSATGGALLVTGATSAITITRNVFSGNEARGYSADNSSGKTGGGSSGGAIAIYSSAVDLTNNVFVGNIARGGNAFSQPGTPLATSQYGGPGDGGAIFFAGSGTVANNTFRGNTAIGGNGGISSTGTGDGSNGRGGAIFAGGFPAPSIANNIFSANAATSGTGGTPAPSSSGAVLASNAPSNTNNLFFGNLVSGGASTSDDAGINAVNADPQFHNAPGNLHIGLPSPARAAGSPTFMPSVDLDGATRPNPPTIGAYEASGADMPVMDLNGDMRSDVLYRNETTGQVYRFLANGLTLSSGALVYTEPNTAWRVVAEADFTGDGVSDLLWRNSSTGQVYMMPFTTSGVPGAGGFIYTEPNPAWRIVQTPDLNGDGIADLVWWNSTTGQVYGMLMNGGFGIAAQGFIYTEPNTQWQIAGAGDFSGSGRQNQLVWRNVATGQVYLMTVSFNGAAFSQSGQIIYNSILPYKIVAVADFNGDGRSDLLWRHDSTGEVYLMIMNGPAITSEAVIYAEPSASWKIVAAGDYDGNGKSDILWRNVSSGQVYMMLMNGGTISSQGFVYTEPNTAWKVLGPYEFGQ